MESNNKSSIPDDTNEDPLPSDNRHELLSDEEALKSKDVIIEFARAYSADLAAERFGVSRYTVRLWLKQHKIPVKPVYNSPGQGRKITYSRELDNEIAEHFREMLNKGERVTVQEVCTYARKLIQNENPDFTASTGWAQRFLTRNNIDLSAQVKKLIPTTRHTNSPSSASPDNRGRPLSYSAETDNMIADWVRNRTERGEVITNSELRKYAKGIISKQNPNFTGSASWAQNFLLRHRLSLHPSASFHTPSSKKPTPSGSSAHTQSPDTLSVVPSLQLMSSQVVCEGGQPTSQEGESPNTSTPQLSSSVSQTTLVSSLASESSLTTPSVDDGVTSTLALLASENIQVEGDGLTQSQAAATLTLSDLTSDPTLAEILGASQDPTATGGFTQATLDTPVSQLSYLNSLGQQLSDLVVAPTVSSTSTLTTPPSTSHTETEPVGSGTRPLSYTKETDNVLANWVKAQQAAGYKVTFASLRAYAKKMVSPENPSFNASVGWVTPFLLRHNLDLKVNDKRIRSTRKTAQPRKLRSKGEGSSQEDMELSTEEGEDEGDMDLQPLPIISSEGFNTEETEMKQGQDDKTESEDNEHVRSTKACVKSETDDKNVNPLSKRFRVSNRSRHTLAEKLEVVRLMKEHNLAGHYVSKLLGIANSTLSGWIKLVDQKGSELQALSTNKKRSNRTGQGRPLTYSKEKDEAIAQWVRDQQEIDVPISAQELTVYATNLIHEENPNFIASVGWRHKFLLRHNLQLTKGGDSKSSTQEDIIPLPVQTEEVCTVEYTSTTPPTITTNDKEYPSEILTRLADWARIKLADSKSLSIQMFCKQAEELILPIDPMFVATLGWVFKFLHKHSIMLDPRPTTVDVTNRKRLSTTDTEPGVDSNPPPAAKKPNTNTPVAIVAAAMGLSTEGLTISPSTGNLCEALLSLSSQNDQIVCDTTPDTALATTTSTGDVAIPPLPPPIHPSSSSKSYFGKSARELTAEEKEEVVRYANAMTLQKAAIKYGVAAPTVWRWRMELKLHQPKYTANQKKYIVKFAETNSLKDAASRFGITSKTIQNWKKALQQDGTLSDVEIAAIPPPSIQDMGEPTPSTLTTPSTSGGLIPEEVIPIDNSNFEYIVDGGEVTEGTHRISVDPTSTQQQQTTGSSPSLEVTHEVQVQDVGMEYDVISSEGHAAKPRCTQEEKNHILQYALDHSIKEASVKYGVSSGTLYYWKKNHLTTKSKMVTGNEPATPSEGGMTDSCANITGPSDTSPEPTVVNVSVPVDIGTSSIMQTSTADTDALQNFTIADTSAMLGDGSVPTSSLIHAITQTLASATPEQLHSLQQITSDFTLLQAVTSLLNTQPSSVPSTATATNSSDENDLHHMQVSTDELPVTIEEVTTSQTAMPICDDSTTVVDVAMETSEEVEPKESETM